MLLLILSIVLSLQAQADAPGALEKQAAGLAEKALLRRDPEARFLVCNFSRMAKERAFTCYSADLGPSATCDDGSRSAPFYIIEGSLDDSSQPTVGKIEYSEACEGVRANHGSEKQGRSAE